jgi:hypothetical protein
VHRRSTSQVSIQHSSQHGGEETGLLRWGDLTVGDPEEQSQRVVINPEWRHPLHRGIQRRTQREHISGKTSLLTPGRFRGQIGGCPRQDPGRSHRTVTHSTGNPKVSDLRGTVVGDQHVARLDIAMHDARLVRGAQRGGDLAADPGHLFRGQRTTLGQHGRQALGL